MPIPQDWSICRVSGASAFVSGKIIFNNQDIRLLFDFYWRSLRCALTELSNFLYPVTCHLYPVTCILYPPLQVNSQIKPDS
ncbi:MAG: hypothetical protein QNJ36_11820 [Calothrix sp. MO_167.B42]|nr:hypothetical protein [Calothrix sp. MO_167.B42]